MTVRPKPSKIPKHLIIIFLLLSLGIGASGYFYYKDHEKQIKKNAEEELSAIAELKVNQILNWRKERMGNANTAFRSPFITSGIHQWLKNPSDPALNRGIVNWMTSFNNNYGYESILLLDPKGALRLSVPEGKIIDCSYIQHQAAEALLGKKIILTDLHKSGPSGRIHLGIVIPLLAPGDDRSPPISVLVLQVDPYQFLYPLIQSWPTASPTAETLLVRREGNEVVYLNELRHRKNTALSLRFPISHGKLPAAMAILGQEGIVEGLDYRGVPVVGALRRIPDSSWFLVAKVDREEVYAAIHERALTIAILASILVVGAGVTLGLFGSQQRAQFYRKQYEIDLKHQALVQRFDYLTKYANDIFFLIDEDLKIVEANNRALSSYGYTHDELLQLNARELRPPDLRLAMDEQIKQLVESNGLVYETLHQRKNGTTFPVEVSSRLIEVEGRKVYQSIVRDITERRRAEKVLRESEDRYRDLVENSQDLMCTHDLQGNFLSVNPAAAKLLGYDRSTILNMNVRDILAQEVRDQFPSYLDTIRTDGVSKGLMLVQTARGERRVLEYNNTLRTEGVSSPIVRTINRDITERWQAEQSLRESENRYRVLVETSPDAIVLFDLNFNVIMANRLALRLFGYQRQEEVVGKSVLDYLAPEQLARATEDIRKVLETGSIGPVEYTLLKHDGTFFVAELKASLFLDREKKPNAILCVSRDITERKKAEEALLNAAQQWRITFDGISDIVCLLDSEGRILRCNKAMVNLLGRPFSEIIGRPCWEIVHGAQVPIEECPVERLWKTCQRETSILSINDRWFSVAADPLLDEGGRPVGVVHIMSDVTERKQAEEAIRESEKRYRQVIENAVEIIYTTDANGNFTYANSAAQTTVGYSLEELQRLNYLNLILPEHRDRVSKIYISQFRERQATTYVEFPFFNKSGEVLWFGQNASLVTEDGKIAGFHIIARDITARKQAEEALKRSEQRYRALVESSTDAILMLDLERNMSAFNQAFLDMFGYERSEVEGRSIRIIHPSDESFRSFGDAVYPVIRELGFFRGEWEMRHKNSTILPVETVTSAIKTPDGLILGYISTIRDITERKRAEEALRRSEGRYRNILESIQDGYFENDLDGNFTFINDVICKHLGYTKEELIGMNYRQYANEENVKELYQHFSDLYRKGHPIKPFAVEYIRRDRSKLIAEISVSLIRDSEGKPVGFRGISRDVTERKQAEEEKSSLQEQLRQSQKMEAIGQLAGGVAHDFNNLLTVIRGYSQLSLLDLKENDTLLENIHEIEKATQRATDLTRQLLAFSRRQILNPKVLDLNTLLKDLEKMLRRLIGEDIELASLLSGDLGKVKVDPSQIEQVIFNLAVNARDAMPSGGKLTIETANVELDEKYAQAHVSVPPGRYVSLSVSDTGIGMTREVKERVFEPFFTTKEKGKGTGLGLSTVYGIVKQSGGNIWVYSEPGQGTTLKIYLPRVDEPLEELKERVIQEELPRGSETILIVEDEEEVRRLAVRILKGQGYTILDAADGDGALVICEKRKEPIHLILTDVVMPGMSGRQLGDRCWQVRQDFKVLYMSGYTDNAIAHHGVLGEGINYLQKPFTMNTLAKKVREVLDE